MTDITAKSSTLREAIAQAVVTVGSEGTIRLIQEDKVPKGNVFAMAKAAGLLGVKKTPELLPDCHPIPIEYTSIEYQIEGLEITILMTVKTIYKTGVEVEAMHGASVVALTMYDMLKPVDKQVEIKNIRLLSKKGGKSGNKPNVKGLSAHVVVCSDSISLGEKKDRAGRAIHEKLTAFGLEDIHYSIVPDEKEAIQQILLQNARSLLIYTGGTGLGPRDITPDVIVPRLERRLPGVEEAMRRYGQDRMPLAMLSRSVAGVKNGNVVLCVPGSTAGATEAMDAVLPGLFHVFHVLEGGGHD